MTRTLLSLATASIFAMGCGHAALDHGAAAPTPAPAKAEAVAAPAPAPAEETKAAVGSDALADAKPRTAARMPGDFVVYRFSGSFRKKPLALTERVVAREGDLLTIDFTAVEGTSRTELRVKIDEASPTHNEVVSVAKLEHGVERPSTLEAYEALMARTALAADANEALVGTEDVAVEVGGASFPAKRTTYRVRVGKHAATLKTFESAAFAWGDIGGEITSTDGKVLYRAEVVESGHGADQAAAMAK